MKRRRLSRVTARAGRSLRRLGTPALLATVLTTGGCALFHGNPVPPPVPPSPQMALTEGYASRVMADWIERDFKGHITGLRQLTAAEQAVKKAVGKPAVAQYAGAAQQHATSALSDARAGWQAVQPKPLSHAQKLASVVHQAYMAQRWAQIALAEAGRETGLRHLAGVNNALVAREAADQRWVGKKLVPGPIGDVQFASGTDRLTADSQATVQKMVAFLQKHPRYGLDIRGHTDNRPPSPAHLRAFLDAHPKVAAAAKDANARAVAYNQAVSQRRARALRKALLDAGIDPARIAAHGYGASKPVAGNDTAAGRRRNRRVVAVVTLKAGKRKPPGKSAANTQQPPVTAADSQ